MKAKSRLDMTSGPLFGNILRFILPLILTNLLQQFYHAADVMIVGLSSDLNAIGAVGATGTYLGLIRNIFIGFSVGASVVTARYIGAKDPTKTAQSVHTAICMGALFGVIGSVIGIIFTRPVLVMMGYSGTLLTLGARYSYIYLACMPFLSLTNFLSAILHAKGNTKISLYVLSGTGVLNILLNLFFVLVVGLSVEGVAISTAIANLVSAILLWVYLARNKDDCRIFFGKLRIKRDIFAEIARIGFPAGIQSALFSVSNILIQSSILEVNQALTPAGSAYDPVVKGSAAAGSIETFIFAALNSVTTTASTVTGQNVGKNDYRRVRKAFWLLCLVSAAITLIASGSCILFRRPLLALYGIKNSEETLAKIAYMAASTRIFCKWPTFVFYAFMNVCAGTLRGMGKSSTSAAISFVGTCVFRVIWIFTVFRAFENLESIFISYPVSWLLTGICFYFTMSFFIRKRMRAAEQTAVTDAPQ